jgi:hypothetical protein
MEEQDIVKILKESQSELRPSQDFARKLVASLGLKAIETKRPVFDWQFLTTWKVALPLALIVLVMVMSQNWITKKTVLTLPENPPEALVLQSAGSNLQTPNSSTNFKSSTDRTGILSSPTVANEDVFLAQAQAEQSILAPEYGDVSLVSVENQLLDEFGQIYDENQF